MDALDVALARMKMEVRARLDERLRTPPPVPVKVVEPQEPQRWRAFFRFR